MLRCQRCRGVCRWGRHVELLLGRLWLFMLLLLLLLLLLLRELLGWRSSVGLGCSCRSKGGCRRRSQSDGSKLLLLSRSK